MFLMRHILFLLCIISCGVDILFAQVQWNGNNWALSCDFVGNDIGNVRVSGGECGSACYNNPTCTHFTWNSHMGGTCWMKSGAVRKSDAVFTNNPQMTCGIVREQQEQQQQQQQNPSPTQSGGVTSSNSFISIIRLNRTT